MNKKLILIFLFVGKIYCLSADEQVKPIADIDFSKVNGSHEVDRLSFTNIETSMKLMEDNILKLMRELGELKMQVHELKNNVKKEVDSQEKLIEQQKQELKLKSESEIKPVQNTASESAPTVDVSIPANAAEIEESSTSCVGSLNDENAQDVVFTVTKSD